MDLEQQRRRLEHALQRGDMKSALQALHSGGAGCWGAGDDEDGVKAAQLLLEPSPGDCNTALHFLASGEPLGAFGACLLWSLRAQDAGADGVWPARHQRSRAPLLALLLAREPRLVLLAGARNASEDTPLHAAVRSQSLGVLANLLAGLQAALLGSSQAGSGSDGARALQLVLSVPDAEGLTAFELALQKRQWAAARLLAAAAARCRGLPLSQAQLESCTLVQHYLGAGGKGGWGAGSYARPAPGGQAPDGRFQASGSGSTVVEALGGLLSNLWDAFGSAAAERGKGAASAAQQLAAGSSGSGENVPLEQGVLQPQALDQAGVLALAAQEEQQALRQQLVRALVPAAAAGSSQAGPSSTSEAAEGGEAQPDACAAAGEAGKAAAGDSEGAANGGSAAQHCIVCYEGLPAGAPRVQLRCGHATCDACWRGILRASIEEGDPRRAKCPEPGCPVALPLGAAQRLLGATSLRRFQQLVAQRYVSTHQGSMRSCPKAGCGATLRLAGSAAAAAAAGAAGPGAGDLPCADAGPAAASGAMAGAGLDAECAACGHCFCWRCSEECHEPATCSQYNKWSEELAALRRAAPDADRQWLTRNSKRCPQCQTHIQRNGGCNHMICPSCRTHFCWQCGRHWSQHSADTGGFYYCSLERREDMPEYSEAADGGGGFASGPLAWLAGVWSSVRAAAQQQQLQAHLRQYLRHSGGRGQLLAAALHMQALLAATGVLGSGCLPEGSAGGTSAKAGHAAGRGAAFAAPPGPELLGLSSREARQMGRREWGDVVAAAAAAATQALAAPVPPAAAAGGTAGVGAPAEAALQVPVSPSADGAGSASGEEQDSQPGAYLLRLAAALAEAHGLLQHCAVAAYGLPHGPARRQLQALTAAIQARVEQLEPLLLALPERDSLPAPPPLREMQQQAAAAAAQAGKHPQIGNGGGGLAGWLLRRLYGVEHNQAAACHPGTGGGGSPGDKAGGGGGGGGTGLLTAEQRAALAPFSGDVLVQQAQLALAVHHQRQAVAAALAGLQADLGCLRAAARLGAFAPPAAAA